MELHFHKQQNLDCITVRDEIELYNCEDHGMNGNYIVANINEATFDVTLVGTGAKSGYVTMITLGEEEDE